MRTIRTRVKACGITRPSDAELAVSLGVDAIGMILHADSPRTIALEQAQEIRAVVPAFVSLVGVFVDAPRALIDQAANAIGLDLIQLHGNEDNAFGESLNTPFIKAIRAKAPQQVNDSVAQFTSAKGLLLDPYVKGQAGGTGQRLQHDLWPKNSVRPLILAGGLSPQNLASALSVFRPFAVDLNSGIESAPGLKDSAMLGQAMRIVHAHTSESLNQT